MKIKGMDRLMRVVRRLSSRDEIMKSISPALVATGEEIRSHLVRYPGRPSYPLRWASAKQRFYVLYVLRKGMGPYRRTTDPMSQRLQTSWSVEYNRPWRVIVGTRATYAPYVQSSSRQQPFHADTGWITDEEAVSRVESSGALEANVNDVVEKMLDA